MRRVLLLVAAASVVTVAVAEPDVAQSCADADYLGRACTPTQQVCDSPTATPRVQLGGEGSFGTADGCRNSPARDESGVAVEADLDYRWERDTDGRGVLSLTAYNRTCAGAKSGIGSIGFNAADALPIAGGSLMNATLHDEASARDVTAGWSLGPGGDAAGCSGRFDWELRPNTEGNGGMPSQRTFVLPGQWIEFRIEFLASSGLLRATACDFANAMSQGAVPAQAAAHFRSPEGPPDVDRSTGVSSSCRDVLYAELASFAATPGDGEVVLEWSTQVETGNAGFHVIRRNAVTGETIRVNDGLIPGDGDPRRGAYYRLVDDSAVNGVLYEYTLVDVGAAGLEGSHPGVAAVANPLRPPIRLVSPEYGDSTIRDGERVTFRWSADSLRHGLLTISADPTFAALSRTMVIPVPVGRRNNGAQHTLTPRQAERMALLAAGNRGVVYWRVVERTGASRTRTSPTYSAGYLAVPDPAGGAPGAAR